MEFTIAEILEATGGRLAAGPGEGPAGRVVTDTRALQPGQTFVALCGERFDGHDFAADATKAGAACVIVERAEALGESDRPEPAIVVVPDTYAALEALGTVARDRLACPVVGITGSCGKTTLKEMIGQVLGRRLRGRTPPKSFNNRIGVPLTLLATEADDEFVLCELGTSAPGEIASLAAVARPTIGVVTLVAPAHLEGLGTVEAVAKEKEALVEALPPGGVAVLNADDPRVAGMAAACRGRAVTVGEAESAELRVTDVEQTEERLRFAVEGVRFELTVLGRHQGMLAAAAAAVAHEFGLTTSEAAEALRAFRPPKMRLGLRRAGDVLVLDDAYNANPASMAAALDLLAVWPNRRKVFFCGEMRELGDASEEAHADLGRRAVESGVARLVCVGPLTGAAARGAKEAVLSPDAVDCFADSVAAAEAVPGIVEAGDVVLVKGSRTVRMERIIEALVGRAARAANAT
jgi:UDP-N-acetylmuramoyl-tripeptide--D-alanyl-D-alanine ligase